ncbi:MAG: CHAT domain-containing protein [Acidimicrobiia bacterium]|nr:CHAT domain-containing protein [Acidimicrobiia bacterium]
MLRQQGGVEAETVRELLAQGTGLVQSEPAAAERLLEVSRLLSQEAGAPDVAPAATYLLARLRLNEGRPDAALDLIAEARRGWDDLGRPLDSLRTELGRMYALDELGLHAEAVDAAQAVLVELDRLAPLLGRNEQGQASWLRAATLENLGVALGLTGRHDQALAAYSDAQAIHDEAGSDDDAARISCNRGVELVALGRPAEAVEALEAASARWAALGDHLGRATSEANAMEAELLLGAYASALRRYERAQAQLVALGAWPELCRLQLAAVRACAALNLLDEGREVLVEVVNRLRKLGLRHDEAVADWLTSVVSLRLGLVERALAAADRAIAGAREVHDPSLQVRALLARSEALAASGETDPAREAAEAALSLGATGRWPTEEVQARLHLAQLVDVGDAERAAHVEAAAVLAEELGLAPLLYPARLELARSLRRRGATAAARRSLIAAVDVVEQLRWLVPNGLVRTSFFQHRTEAHAELIGLTLAEDPGAGLDAYLVAERAKARTLSDVLAGALTHDDAGAGFVGPVEGGRSDWPGWEVAGAPAVPAMGDQVVEYHLVDGHFLAFVWRDGELRVVTGLGTDREVAALLSRWDVQLRRRQLGNGVAFRHLDRLRVSAERVLHDLWRLVFRPVEALLDPARRDVLVVPHGPLHGVPFHALASPDGPLGARWDVTVAASFDVADRMRPRGTGEPGGRSLVVGVPDERAPAMAAEAQAVADLLGPAQLLLGGDATVDAVWSAAPRSDVIHLACHGVHRPASPLFSSLRLADRSITARDVLDLELRQPLVVLSACESGRQGGAGRLDEAVGFAHSFLLAGAGAVVASLWLADDTVTAELMALFYQALERLPPAQALGAAQAAVAARHPHPADWAAFVFYGPAPAPPPARNRASGLS